MTDLIKTYCSQLDDYNIHRKLITKVFIHCPSFGLNFTEEFGIELADTLSISLEELQVKLEKELKVAIMFKTTEEHIALAKKYKQSI